MSAAERVKRVVLCLDDEGSPRVVGPVHSAKAAEKLRDEITAAGWEPQSVTRLDSVAAFRNEVRVFGTDGAA